jgi:hypothetical protein
MNIVCTRSITALGKKMGRSIESPVSHEAELVEFAVWYRSSQSAGQRWCAA